VLKRVRWVTAGAALGFGSSVWLQRRLKAAVDRYLPEQVGHRATDRARAVTADLRAALAEGRTAMRERERELRAHLEPAASPPDGDSPARPGHPAYRHLRVVDADEVPARPARRRGLAAGRPPRR
jgi:hypothetical protein